MGFSKITLPRSTSRPGSVEHNAGGGFRSRRGGRHTGNVKVQNPFFTNGVRYHPSTSSIGVADSDKPLADIMSSLFSCEWFIPRDLTT